MSDFETHTVGTAARIAALVKRLEEARGVIDDLMAQMDWVGTGDYKTAELEKFEFEQRIAAAFLAGGE
jgi:hypothetical protein